MATNFQKMWYDESARRQKLSIEMYDLLYNSNCTIYTIKSILDELVMYNSNKIKEIKSKEFNETSEIVLEKSIDNILKEVAKREAKLRKSNNDFIKLTKEATEIKLSLDEDRMIINGPVLIPNQKIYRSAENLGLETDGYIYFTEETIKEMFELFMTNMCINNITSNHKVYNEDLILIETWISVDNEKDKSVALGYKLPKGTWFVSYKVNNPELWKRIKLGEFNGFNIESNSFDKELIDVEIFEKI